MNYDRIPEHMRESVRGYIEEGRPLGGFLTALFSNDLQESFARADEINRYAMFDWACFIHNEMPGNSHGSLERIQEWQEAHRADTEERAAMA